VLNAGLGVPSQQSFRLEAAIKIKKLDGFEECPALKFRRFDIITEMVDIQSLVVSGSTRHFGFIVVGVPAKYFVLRVEIQEELILRDLLKANTNAVFQIGC